MAARWQRDVSSGMELVSSSFKKVLPSQGCLLHGAQSISAPTGPRSGHPPWIGYIERDRLIVVLGERRLVLFRRNLMAGSVAATLVVATQ
jgi:hypothetical protein